MVAKRARGRERFIQACMYVTIALNAYANGRRRRSWLWLSRAVACWPPTLVDSRFWGAVARALAGPSVLSAMKLSAQRLGRGVAGP